MIVYVIVLCGGRMLGWNGTMPPEGLSGGWRPFIWTPHLHEAEQFNSAEAATLYARGAMKHDQWNVGSVTLGAGEDVA